MMGKIELLALIVMIYTKVGHDLLRQKIVTLKVRRSWIKNLVKSCMHDKS